MILPLIQNMKTLKNGKNLEVSTYKLLIVLASNRNQHANYCPINNTNHIKYQNYVFFRICTLFSPKPKWHIFTQTKQ